MARSRPGRVAGMTCESERRGSGKVPIELSGRGDPLDASRVILREERKFHQAALDDREVEQELSSRGGDEVVSARGKADVAGALG